MKGGSWGGKGGQIGPSGFIVRKIASFLTLIPGQVTLLENSTRVHSSFPSYEFNPTKSTVI